MKETHLFYSPRASLAAGVLPPEEARHAVKVLRLKPSDELWVTDGEGCLCHATVTMTSRDDCAFHVDHRVTEPRSWKSRIVLAVAPTKQMERMEWLAEKATEIGVDEIILLNCKNSERRSVRADRLERIVISAMKQSHKSRKPKVSELTNFDHFLKIQADSDLQRFIAVCLPPTEEEQHLKLNTHNFLGDLVAADRDTVVAIGPEGDFSSEEVTAALQNGFTATSLGESRLRTETAALVAVHLMYLAKR